MNSLYAFNVPIAMPEKKDENLFVKLLKNLIV